GNSETLGGSAPSNRRRSQRSPTGDPWSFFFSSRRRHTRSYGDWSSDVCSSDLVVESADEFRAEIPLDLLHQRVFHLVIALLFVRSEERRVGKECRSRWSS